MMNTCSFERKTGKTAMKYEKCLECNQLGNTCDGPNLMAMETHELGLWCNELRKKKPGMTFDKIANETGVSKSAVHGFLTGAHTDYRRDTFRPIVKYITGGKWDDNPCGNISNSEKAALEEKIRQLEEGITLRDERIKDLTNNNQAMTTLITNTNRRHDEANANHETQLKFLRGQIKSKNRTVIGLAIPLVICVLIIIIALLIDRTDPSKGYFWLESLLRPYGSNGITMFGNI